MKLRTSIKGITIAVALVLSAHSAATFAGIKVPQLRPAEGNETTTVAGIKIPDARVVEPQESSRTVVAGTFNGLLPNGLTVNGWDNGLIPNGITANGRDVNGIRLNGQVARTATCEGANRPIFCRSANPFDGLSNRPLGDVARKAGGTKRKAGSKD